MTLKERKWKFKTFQNYILYSLGQLHTNIIWGGGGGTSIISINFIYQLSFNSQTSHVYPNKISVLLASFHKSGCCRIPSGCKQRYITEKISKNCSMITTKYLACLPSTNLPLPHLHTFRQFREQQSRIAGWLCTHAKAKVTRILTLPNTYLTWLENIAVWTR